MTHAHDFRHDGAHHNHDFHHDVHHHHHHHHHHGIGHHHTDSDIHHNIHHHPPVSSSATGIVGLSRPADGNAEVPTEAGNVIFLMLCFGMFGVLFLTTGIVMIVVYFGTVQTVGIVLLMVGAILLVLFILCCWRKHQLQQREQQAIAVQQAGVIQLRSQGPNHSQGPGATTIAYGPGGQVPPQTQPTIQPSPQQYPATTPYLQQKPAVTGPSEAPPAYEDVVKPASTPKEDGQVV